MTAPRFIPGPLHLTLLVVVSVPLFVPRNGEGGSRTFSFMGIKLWQDLDLELKEKATLPPFKASVKSNILLAMLDLELSEL